MTGVLPASALWVVAFMGLGFFVGAPVERLLGRLQAYGVRALVVAAVVAVWVVAARRLPAVKTDPVPARPGWWRLAAALLLDSAAVSSVAGALSLLAGLSVETPRSCVSWPPSSRSSGSSTWSWHARRWVTPWAR